MATAWRVRVGSVDDLNLVEPLWVAVHHRHIESMPGKGLAPYGTSRDVGAPAGSSTRSSLTKPDTLLLLA